MGDVWCAGAAQCGPSDLLQTLLFVCSYVLLHLNGTTPYGNLTNFVYELENSSQLEPDATVNTEDICEGLEPFITIYKDYREV